MKIEDYILEVDSKLSKKLESDLESNDYSPQDARVATVLTRIDVGLIVAATTYNSKLLSSVKLGVWGIFSLLLIDVILRIIA